MTDREFLAIKRINRICRNWYENFKIEHNGDNIVFTMEQMSQDYLDSKTVYYFVSNQNAQFCYRDDLRTTYIENEKIKKDEYFPAIILHIFAQICDVLDGLLDSYYIGRE